MEEDRIGKSREKSERRWGEERRDMGSKMMNEGKRIDWRDLGNVQDSG